MSHIVRTALVIALALSTRPLAAQDSQPQPEPAPADRWQLTLEADGGEPAYVWDVRLVRLDKDTLIVRQADSLRHVPVARITEVRRIEKSEMRVGKGAAGAMSALTGADDEVYDLTPLDFAGRLRTVQKIMLSHPPSRD